MKSVMNLFGSSTLERVLLLGFYIIALVVFFLQTIWYYSSSPALYVGYLLLHFVLFLSGMKLARRLSGSSMLMALCLAIVIAQIPFEIFVPTNLGLLFDLENHSRDLSSLLNGAPPRLRAIVDVLFYPVIYFLLFLGGRYLGRGKMGRNGWRAR